MLFELAGWIIAVTIMVLTTSIYISTSDKPEVRD
jgi:hypothetical protein